MNNNDSAKKALWLIIGIAIGAVLILLGLLVYNNYVNDDKVINNNNNSNNKTEELENNNQQDDDDIKIANYDEIDISKQNIYPIYRRFENDSIYFETSENKNSIGKFVIENNKLYFELEGTKNIININNPKKAVICDIGQDSSIQLCVLTNEGNVYTAYTVTQPEHLSYDGYDTKNVNSFAKYMNENINLWTGLNNISDISAIIYSYGNIYSAWEDMFFTYTKNNEEYTIPAMDVAMRENEYTKNIKDIKLDIGPVSISYDNSVYDENNNKLNIKPKYLIEYIPETGHAAFLDENNYLYVSAYNGNDNINKGKVVKVYNINNKYNDIVVKFADGTLKNLSEYHNW